MARVGHVISAENVGVMDAQEMAKLRTMQIIRDLELINREPLIDFSKLDKSSSLPDTQLDSATSNSVSGNDLEI